MMTASVMGVSYGIRGGMHSYAHSPIPINVDTVRLRRSLVAQQVAKIETFWENTQKFEFAVSNTLIKNRFFDLPLPTPGTLARHTYHDIC